MVISTVWVVCLHCSRGCHKSTASSSVTQRPVVQTQLTLPGRGSALLHVCSSDLSVCKPKSIELCTTPASSGKLPTLSTAVAAVAAACSAAAVAGSLAVPPACPGAVGPTPGPAKQHANLSPWAPSEASLAAGALLLCGWLGGGMLLASRPGLGAGEGDSMGVGLQGGAAAVQSLSRCNGRCWVAAARPAVGVELLWSRSGISSPMAPAGHARVHGNKAGSCWDVAAA